MVLRDAVTRDKKGKKRLTEETEGREKTRDKGQNGKENQQSVKGEAAVRGHEE